MKRRLRFTISEPPRSAGAELYRGLSEERPIALALRSER